jgi:two-component system, NtrC family, response regulator PilR
MPSVLLVDDEPDILEVLEIVMLDEGFEVQRAESARTALSMLRSTPVDIVISDIRMPDMSGVELLKEAQEIAPETTFVMMTAFATTETAIEALQHGAFDYLSKPFNMDDIRTVVRNALSSREQTARPAAPEVAAAQTQHGQQLFQALHRSRLVGRSPKMLEVYRTIGTVAGTGSTVLVTGESGTGKELVARAIHQASRRAAGPFITINCGAFPETLLESELFGYSRGAFTGAVSNKKGLFEIAHHGTIFLDEIAEMSPPMQVKLLRVLQERRLRSLGSTTELPVDVRVIAATNRDLRSAQQEGQFREDLYYRIAVINIHLPALRDRIEDIELLATHFLRHFAERSGKRIQRFSEAALSTLASYRWPGNVRELENTIERAVALETEEEVQLSRLPDTIIGTAPPTPSRSLDLPEGPFDLEGFLSGVERDLIRQALERTQGNQTLAAELLQLTKPSLRHKLQTLGIDASTFRRGSQNS